MIENAVLYIIATLYYISQGSFTDLISSEMQMIPKEVFDLFGSVNFLYIIIGVLIGIIFVILNQTNTNKFISSEENFTPKIMNRKKSVGNNRIGHFTQPEFLEYEQLPLKRRIDRHSDYSYEFDKTNRHAELKFLGYKPSSPKILNKRTRQRLISEDSSEGEIITRKIVKRNFDKRIPLELQN